jgi:hypothetical protein
VSRRTDWRQTASRKVTLTLTSTFELVGHPVELVKSWLVSELVRGLLRFSCCELLLLETGS